MNSRSKMKNIIVNFTLVFAMVLSIIGSAFLLKPLANNLSAAEDVLLQELPANMKFTATTTTATATDYNSTDGYIYDGSSLNYINATGLTYYYKPEDNKLYSDPEYKNEAKDILWRNYNDVNGTIEISKANENSYSEYTIHTDLYTFLYQGTRHYFYGGRVYTNADHTNETTIKCTVQFEVKVNTTKDAATYTDSKETLTTLAAGTSYYTGIEEVTLYSIGYYPIKTSTGDNTGFYIKSDTYDEIYYDSTSGIKEVTVSNADDGTFDRIKPMKIYFENNSVTAGSNDSINQFANIASYNHNGDEIFTKYYSFEGQIYPYPMLRSFVSSNEIVFNLDPYSKVTITEKNPSEEPTQDKIYYPVSIDGVEHYILHSTDTYVGGVLQENPTPSTELKMYDKKVVAGVATLVEVGDGTLLNSNDNLQKTMPYEYNIKSIDRTNNTITISRKDADNDTINNNHETLSGSINVNYYFTNETITNSNDATCNIVIINGKKYAFVKPATGTVINSNFSVFNAVANGGLINENEHKLNIVSIDSDKVVINFPTGNAKNPTKFSRYGAQYLYNSASVEEIPASSGKYYLNSTIEGTTYYFERTGASEPYTYVTTPYLKTASNTVVPTTEITVTAADVNGVTVASKPYYYVANILCVKNTNIKTETIVVDEEADKAYPIIIMGETYYVRKIAGVVQLKHLYTTPTGTGSCNNVMGKWSLIDMDPSDPNITFKPIRSESNEIQIKIEYNSPLENNEKLGEKIYTIPTTQNIEINIELTSFKTVAGISHKHYPVTINGKVYYIAVKTDGTLNSPGGKPMGLIYQFSGVSGHPYGTAANATEYVYKLNDAPAGENWKLINIVKTGNFITVMLNSNVDYALTYENAFYKYEFTTLENHTNFVSYNAKYFYHNTKLYLDNAHTQQIQDFDYETNVSKVLINNAYIDIETTGEYKYVELFGKTYYFDGTHLYSSITLGGNDKITYQNKVEKAKFGYRVNTDINIITIFDNSSTIASIDNTTLESDNISEIIAKDDEIDDASEVKGIVKEPDTDTEYLVVADQTDASYTRLYSLSALKFDTNANDAVLIDYRWLNINYELTFTDNTCATLVNTDADGDGKLNDTLKINGTPLLLTNPSNSAQFVFGTIDEYGNPNAPYYKIFLNDTNKALYYTTSFGLNGTNTEPEEGSDFPVVSPGPSKIDNVISSESYRDFIVNTANNSVLFANASQDVNYSYTNGGTFTYLGTQFKVDGDKIKQAEYGADPVIGPFLDATEMIFWYEAPQDMGNVDGNNTLTVTKFNGIYFEDSQSQIASQTFNYIQSGSQYYIVGKYGSNTIDLFISIQNSSTTSSQNPATDGTFEIMATSVKFSDQAKYTAIENSVNKQYSAHESFPENGKFDNGSTIFLNNYTPTQQFFNNTVPAAGTTINLVYLGFNEKYDTGIDYPINQGITSLTVTGYLKNDFIMKYFSTTEGFNNSYGISININNPVIEEVKYNGQATSSVNYYWYQHLDLSGLKANVDYSQEYNNGDILTEVISETSGLYSFIFNFTYLESSGSSTTTQTYEYVFQFYLTENSDYIEYPTFNTYLTKENVAVSTPTEEPDGVNATKYYDIVSNTTASKNLSSVTYTYNNQSFDKPVYVFDASKYNVSYDFKYNLENHVYTSTFEIPNAGKASEYGLLSIFKDSDQNPYAEYFMYSKKFNNGVAIDYYTKAKNDQNPSSNLYGSLYIDPAGNYLLSLEDYFHYNPANKATYGTNEISYYSNGRLIKNGAQNTPESYYFPLMLTDLGDYTFTNKYLISIGNTDNTDTSHFKVLDNDTTDVLQGFYSIKYNNVEITGLDIEGQEVTRFAYYNTSGEFILPSTIQELNSSLNSVGQFNYLSKSSNPTLKIYGINTTFNKDGNEVSFNKLDENIFSDITPDTQFKDKDGANISFTNDLITNSYKGTLKFDSDYSVPITNLQPIYFRYYGTFDYTSSYYYRYQNCSYLVNENGTINQVDFSQSTRTSVGFTNKTSISSSGFYIVEVKYQREDGSGTTDQVQYFMFAIDNSAPNLELYVANETDGSDKTLFISSTAFSQTSRYTNKMYIIPKWQAPNYFQGEIVVKYKIQNYGLTQTLQAEKQCSINERITTRNGRFSFTITYGVNGISSTSTYIIVDQVIPTGSLYSSYEDTELNYFISSQYAYNVFNSPVTFASTLSKPDSGAKVTARMTSISLNAYSDYGQIINTNAITTNVEIDATSSSFNNTLNESPIFNFFNIENARKDEQINRSQLLGLSDDSTIYIIKLYDEAGNESIYYYLYDNSTPYLKYKQEGGADFVDSFEDNTTNANTTIYWHNYKAIHINTDGTNRELFANLTTLVNENKNNTVYGKLEFKEVSGELYLFVPISQASLTSKIMVNGISSNYTASTVSNKFSGNATVFIDTASDDAMNGFNTNFAYNPSINAKEFFRGNRDYQIKVTDSIGNTLSKKLWVNGSFAQEKFEGIRENSSTKYRLTEDTAYNLGQITTTYKALTEQNFYAQISYDYYGIDFNNYLNNSDSDNEAPFATVGYDLQNSVQYMYDASTNLFVEYAGKDESGNNMPKYTYIDNEDKYYTYDEVNAIANKKFYLPGYPYVQSTSGSIVTTTETTKNGTTYKESGIIHEENQLSKQGLYVFKRVYIDNISGREITQNDITAVDSQYKVLENDRAIRYYIYYVDRNDIINLVYDGNGNIDPIQSIGNLLEIFLGQDLTGQKDPVIDAETLNSGTASMDIVTNKLKVETNFTADKYATANKLSNLFNYTYEANAITGIGEDLSIIRNNNTFNYLINLTVNNKKVIENNVINAEHANLTTAITNVLVNKGGKDNAKTNITNYQFITASTVAPYTLTISDNTFVHDNDSGEPIENSANSLTFRFGINHSSPQGGFITLLDNGSSIKEMTVRSESLDSSGRHYTYSSSNVENLSFTFKDSESQYDATINPYQIVIEKGQYSNGSANNFVKIFETNKVNSTDYWNTFSTSVIHPDASQSGKLEKILYIYDRDGNDIHATGKDNGSPYTYRINIFNKEDNTLITDYSKDAVYKVTVNYIGTSSDYIVNSSNFFTSTFTIHIDRVAPQNNLKNLIAADPNLNEYCIEKYGVGYSLLNSEQQQVIIETYAFHAKYVTEDNIPYYYAKDNFGSKYSNITDLAEKEAARYSVLDKYSTYFIHNYDDSNRIYVRSVGNDVRDYKYSILPSQEGYDKVEQFQDHQRFTPSSTAYSQYDYESGKFYFSNNLPVVSGTDDRVKFDNSYYEIIEEDEAGNFTRYYLYASDNTNVSADYRYITAESDNVDKNNDGLYDTTAQITYAEVPYNVHDRKYFIYNNERYYVIIFEGSEDALVGKISNNTFTEVTKINGEDVAIEEESYSYYYDNGNVRKTVDYIMIGSEKVELLGNQLANLDYENTDPLEVLNASSIHFLYPAVAGAVDSYLFDDFFTVKIYQGQYSLVAVPALTFVSNPHDESYNLDSFMTMVTAQFKQLISDSTGVYEYTVSITNRFNKEKPYNMSFNLPDQVLELNFAEPSDNTISVTLPSSSNYVKILQFNVYKYEDRTWKPVTTDSKGLVIQTRNIDNYSNGLTSTTYTFEEGQYKFVTQDNYGRINGNGNAEYKIVGGNYDETYTWNYGKHIVDENGTVIVSKDVSLYIDDTIYQITTILKDAVKVAKKDGSFEYYALISDGSNTKLYRYIDGINDKLIYLNGDGMLVEDYSSGCSEIYYRHGRLFKDAGFNNELKDIDLSASEYVGFTVFIKIASNFVYSTSDRTNNKRPYTFSYVCENNIAEYQIRINWTTDPSHYYWTNIKIDRNAPVVTLLLNDGGVLAAVENQNYNKPFTISWTSDYNTTATLHRTINTQTTIIKLTPGESYEINVIAGYTLKIEDEIGNMYTFSFNYVKNANEYFSVFVDDLEILPSDYVVPSKDTGKTIRYYYYKATSSNPDPAVVIKTDETKNIFCEEYSLDPAAEYNYKIIRRNIGNYEICYIKIIKVLETSQIKNFLSSVNFTMKDADPEQHPTSNKTGQVSDFKYTYSKGQDCESFTLVVNKNLSTDVLTEEPIMIGNKIYVKHFYNNTLIRVYSSDSWSTIKDAKLTNKTFDITLSSTGVHRFEFSDSIGNKASQDIEITLIKDIMFTVNDESPIDYRFYNSDVVLDIPAKEYYHDVKVTAKLNGSEINTAEFKKGTKYTFTQAGSYEVYMTAESVDDDYASSGVYNSVYYFTIINPNVTKMTFGFSNSYGFTISKVLKNQADITDLIKSEGIDNMWLTSGNPDSVGNYTITLLGFDKLSNSYLPFTFTVRLNNEIPTITAIDYAFGTKSTSPITVQYNPAVIYSQVGESYIRIIGDNGTDVSFDITAESADALETLEISNDGKYRITIYNKDGIFIASYAVHKTAPLNTSAKIIIFLAIVLVVGLVVMFVILRRHTKFR